MNLKVGVMCGSRIYEHKASVGDRTQMVEDLNKGNLDGLIISSEVGGVGFNAYGASLVIFMGSLHSLAEEEQVIGTGHSKICILISRANLSTAATPADGSTNYSQATVRAR
jgi:superfamily II DNA or RNA helicase